MPTLKSGNGELENGSSEIIKSPGFLTSMMNRAGVVLGIMGATVATDAAAQQAPNNLVPKVAALTAPAVPGTVEDTSRIPTGADVISILQNGKDKIRSKFSTFNDAVFARIVGEISLGSIKPETLGALAGAFPEGSPEKETLISYSESIRAPKLPANLASPRDEKKLPPLNETKEQKAKRIWEEAVMKNANGILSNARAVNYNVSDTASTSLKMIGNTRIFSVDPKERKPKTGTKVRGTANFEVKMASGTTIDYTFSEPEHKKIGTKEIESVRVIFVTKDNKTLNLSGEEDAGFCIVVKKGSVQRFTIPPKATGFTEKIDLVLEEDIVNGTYPSMEFRAGQSSVKIVPAEGAGEIVAGK